MSTLTEEQKDHVRKLVEALRSGRYEQGRGRLREGDCYCCLGVACNVYQAETGEGAWSIRNAGTSVGGWYFDTGGSINGFALTDEVAHWYGLDVNPTFNNLNTTAIGLNDSYRKSFTEIADAFEAEYLS